MKFKKITLGEISKNNRGYYGIGAPAIDFDPNLPTYLRITDITDDGKLIKSDLKSLDDPNYENFVLQKNDIVFARTGNSTGRNYFYNPDDGELIYAGFLIKFSLDESLVFPKYVKYFCQSNKYWGWINSVATGSTRKNINAKMYSDMPIWLPSYEYQIRTVEILEKFDQRIEINNRIISNLEAQAQAIFKSWFVDFDPFQDGEFVESDLGMIPEGWEVKRICEETELFTGFPFKSKTYVEDGEFAVITIKNIMDGSLKLEPLNYIKENPPNLPNDAVLNIGDIVFTMTGNVGRVALIYQDKLLQNQRIGKLILRHEEHRAFYYFLLRNNIYKSEIINLAHGTAQANLGKVDFGNILIPFNHKVIDEFSIFTEPYVKQIILLKKQNIKLAQLRDTLLPKLMSGEIRVGEDNIEENDKPL